MVYIFVLKGKKETHYAVIPSTFLMDNLDKLDEDAKGNIHIYFHKFPDGRVIEGRKKKLELTDYIDNFNWIKSK